MPAGYYRFPTIYQDTIVFVSEDDLWSVPRAGGLARRLTSNLSDATYPVFSPDGEYLAFVSREEGSPEVYVMPAQGGSAQRSTYLGSNCRVIGWTADGTQIIFTSNYGCFVPHEYLLYTVARDSGNGAVTPLPYGPAQSVAFGPRGQVVIGRNMGSDPARWKRYRGGTAGHLWIDPTGDGQFTRLLNDLRGNLASPMWLTRFVGDEVTGAEEGRVFFASDHEGIGNLYSCQPDGTDLRRHTDHEDYYVRNPATDGRRIVYHAGADLYVYEAAADTTTRVAVDYHSPRVQRNRRFVDAARYVDSVGLHPTGRALTVTSRGKLYAFFNHEGPVLQLGKRDGVRYRLPEWLNDSRSIVLISDELGEETLEIHTGDPDEAPRRLEGLDLGRAVNLKVSPTEDKVAISNHRQELLLVDLTSGQLTLVERSPYRVIGGFDWAPDGRWLAYSFAATPKTTEIRLYRLADPGADDATLHQSSIHTVTKPVLHDTAPAFDPEGRYLYFLSYREFNPVYDALHFDLSFPWGMRPYLVTLQADLPNPFIPRPDLEEEEGARREPKPENNGEEPPKPATDDAAEEQPADENGNNEDAGESDDEEAANEGEESDSASDDADEESAANDEPAQGAHYAAFSAWSLQPRHAESPSENVPAAAPAPGKAAEKPAEKASGEAKSTKPPANQPRRLRVDLAGIEGRVVAFPVPDGRYGRIAGIPGKVLFTDMPIRGTLDNGEKWDDEPAETGTLRCYNFKEYKSETLVDNISWFELSRNRKKLLYGAQRRLRVISAGEKPQHESGTSRRTGWIDLSRLKVSVNPQSEWEQMLREAWRLQRDHFWAEDMAEVDWQSVLQRYLPLCTRVSTRGEFSDLLWEMQGELGTSHAYEYGGDYRSRPYYGQGFLGAQFRWDAEAKGYRVGELIIGDPWQPEGTSPLASPGVDVKPGDLLIAVNGQRLSATLGPAQLLVNQAGYEVLLTFAPRGEASSPTTGEQLSAAKTAALPGVDAAPNTDQPPSPQSERTERAVPRNRSLVVRAIHSEAAARYRAWVERNRQWVHEATQGRVGYVHIPDMQARGYAEFHRGYLAAVDHDALIVDVRYNAGGHVSQLILEKLARRRIGYDLSRWGGLVPYPVDSVGGPIVAVTNEHAGSDGDIFSHSFKLLKLGPLIGKRTWGGVVGISPRHALVDGTVTTQPEYSFWFEDVGWTVENYGTDPDIEVDIAPQDYTQGRDPQLLRAVNEVLALLAERPLIRPDIRQRPSRALPQLPPRLGRLPNGQ
jgi:tricorn protease